MILVDTSVWIELIRATGSAAEVRLTNLITAGAPIAVSEPIVMEVLAGAATISDQQKLVHLMDNFTLLPFLSTADFSSAASIYRRCREVGVTPRGMLDCMIAAVAWRNDACILSDDADIVRIADVLGIEVDPGSIELT